MSIDKVLSEVNAAIARLKTEGVTATTEPRPAFDPKPRPHQLHPDQWFIARFPFDSEKMKSIVAEEEKLRGMGIHFDTGASADYRDWFIDSSLKHSFV